MNITHPTESLSDYWHRHIKQWQRTEQSQIAYCRTQELSYHRFTYWHRKLAATGKKVPQSVRSGFVPVKACSTIPQALSATLPNGVILRGIATDNLTIVKQLLGLQA